MDGYSLYLVKCIYDIENDEMKIVGLECEEESTVLKYGS